MGNSLVYQRVSMANSTSPWQCYPGKFSQQLNKWSWKVPSLMDLQCGTTKKQGSLYYQPKQCTIIREIPQNHHTFALFDSPQIGNLMTPEKGGVKMVKPWATEMWQILAAVWIMTISHTCQTLEKIHLSSDQNPGWLGYIGDDKLLSYIGIIISHYQDPHQPISIMKCHKGLERCSFAFLSIAFIFSTRLRPLTKAVHLFSQILGCL